MNITKKDIINALKDDILEHLSNEFYQWVFEDENEIQRIFSERLTQGVLQGMNTDVAGSLKQRMSDYIFRDFIFNNESELKQSIIDKCVEKLTKDIKLEVQLCKK